MKMSEVTKEKIMEMYADYQKGMTIEQVAGKHYFSAATVQKYFARCNLPTRTAAKLRIEDMPRITELLKQGKTYEEIGRIYGCSRTAIREMYSRLNAKQLREEIMAQRRCKKNEELRRETLEMYELYKQGMSKTDIAQKFGCTFAVVNYRFKAMQLPNIKRPYHIGRKQMLTLDMVHEMRDKYAQGVSVSELAKQYHCAESTAYRCIRQFGRE